ncbi:hypothetical protein [uncultured Tessaracoccus sp.]|uniref:hypothetical protein n=1 Tax=uncultured Tessaracoccus sp. TaxID=905023 RepID=UPI0025EAC8F3|nr:hypothetical protein [uncultured Tessaracoccus sp.]
MRYRFNPSSWRSGAQGVDGAAQEFLSAAGATLGRLSNVADTVPAPLTQADQAVLQILVALNAAATRTIAGIAQGLGQEAATMHATGEAYERCEGSNESIAQQAGC